MIWKEFGMVGRIRRIVIISSFVLVVLALGQIGANAMGKRGLSASEKKQPEIAAQQEKENAIPRLVDLGAKKCVPCKMMAPILEELEVEYRGKMEVVFIDVWQQPDEGKKYNIRLIPTQIFFAPDGKELFRHQGFISKEDILLTWEKYGYTFRE
jgi:thioredoxin